MSEPEVQLPPSPYHRFGMDVGGAQAITGDPSIDDGSLWRAEGDIEALVGPRFSDLDPAEPADSTSSTSRHRYTLVGRAIAYQASHTLGLGGRPDGTAVTSEQWPDYSVSYQDGRGPDRGYVSQHVRSLLLRAGLLVESGYTDVGARVRPGVEPGGWRRV